MPQASSIPGTPLASRYWLWAIVGCIIRLVAINQPLIDAHAIRQCYTAEFTQSMLREPGFPLSALINWRGDQAIRVALELPVYNYLTMAMHLLVPSLDASGKLVSIALWLGSFLVLQKIWKYCLNERETVWANAFFVLSPISIFFGQAVTPEMLVQFLGLGFLWMLLRYHDTGKLKDFVALSVFACLGLLVKMPEFFHLIVFAFALLFSKEGKHLFRHWEYWVATSIAGLLVASWSHYITPINLVYDPGWRPAQMVTYHLRTFGDRFDPRVYLRFASYLLPFLMTASGALVIAMGAWAQFRERLRTWPTLWILSLGVYYLGWGFGPAQQHSYYQLPVLAPCCYLFGLGMQRIRSVRQPWIAHYGPPILAGLSLLFSIATTAYLFRQDRVAYDCAQWVRAHSSPTETIFFKGGGPFDSDFPHEPVFAYYADRSVWLDTTYQLPAERQRAGETSAWVVETFPSAKSGWLESVRHKFKGEASIPPVHLWASVAGDPEWTLVHSTEQARIYRRTSLLNASDPSAVSKAPPGNGAEGSGRRYSSSVPISR